ncbi:MAG: twin-arginine translocase TatA/TatE family subunit [Endomicrobia bacterium]|nr:twin-arginine translocase TatA/TatE family subunit [Endomicrobiia bacterium]
MSIGIWQLVVILLVVVILFGGKKIPELAKALGRAAYEFKKARETIENEMHAAENEAKKIEKAVNPEASQAKKEDDKSKS